MAAPPYAHHPCDRRYNPAIMLSLSLRNRLALILTGMIFLHVIFFLGQWRYIRAGLPDFTIFYTAGKLIAQSHGAVLYNDEMQRGIESQFSITVSRGGVILPYNHPPFEAALFVPFARLPYSVSYLIWFAVNMALATAFIILLRRELNCFRTLPRWFYVLIVFAFPPMFIALMQGQDVIWVLFCYGMTYAALRRKSDFSAGIWLALGLVKFHLILPFLFAFVVQKRARVIAGFLAMAAALVFLGFGVVGVRESLAYPAYVWKTDHTAAYRWATDHRYNPNIRALILNTFGNDNRWAIAAVVAVSLILLVASAVAWNRLALESEAGWKLGFALNLCTTLLVSYHTWVQDMSLLLLPILVCLDVLSSQARHGKSARILLWSSAAVLFCSPLYLLLILRFDQFFIIVFAIIAFMAGTVALARSIPKKTEIFAGARQVAG